MVVSAPPTTVRRPTALPVRPEGIPKHLLGDARWVDWRYQPKPKAPGEWTKEPYRAADPTTHASSTNPKTWATFDAAFMAYQTSSVLDGIGWNLEGSGVVGLDLDDAIDERGRIKPWAQEIVDAFPSYWEISPSGTGLRGLALGTLPPGRRKVKHHGCTVEIYDSGRFLTITGHVIRAVEGDELPELQEAIDTIHARVFGGDAVAAGAVAMTSAGRAETVSPEALRVLEAIMGGRYGPQMARAWAGDFADFGGDESDGEWAIAKETAYHAMQLGFEGAALASAIEEVMRAGPYRAKWDTPRTVTLPDGTVVRTTYLGMTIGRAINARAPKGPTLLLDPEPAVSEPEAPAAETPEQELARLRREVAQERAVGAVRASALRYERERASELDRRAKDTRDILRNPSLSPTDKVVFMTIAWRVESGVSRGQDEIRIVYPEIAEASGVSTSTVGRTVKRCAADVATPEENPNAPLVKRTVTEWRDVGGAGMQPTSTVYLRPKGDGSILASAATYVPPEQRKHGGTRLPRCPEHPTADLVIRSTTHCAECDEQLTPTSESLRRQVDSVEDTVAPSVGCRYLKGRQLDSVGTDEADDARARAAVGIETAADRLRKQDAAVGPRSPASPPMRVVFRRGDPPEPAPDGHGESLGPIKATRNGHAPLEVPEQPPPTCCRLCSSLELFRLQDGRWRCDGCGEVAS